MAFEITKKFMEHMESIKNPVTLIAENEEYDITKTRYSTDYATVNVYMSFSDDRYVHMQCTDYVKVPLSKAGEILDMCNKMNSEYRWAKFVFNEDNGSVEVKTDMIVGLENVGEDCLELLTRLLDIIDEAYANFMHVIWAA